MTLAVDIKSFAQPWWTLRHSLASCAQFQIMAGVDGDPDPVASAKTHIKLFWWDWMTTPLTKSDTVRVSLRGLDEDLSTAFAFGEFATSGPIVMVFELVTPAAYLSDHESAGINLLNHLGTIRYQLRDLALADPSQYLPPTEIALGLHGEADKHDHNGVPFWGAELIFSWDGQ